MPAYASALDAKRLARLCFAALCVCGGAARRFTGQGPSNTATLFSPILMDSESTF